MTLAEQPSRTCCVCKKLFCCAQCRERHEKKKHSDLQLKCPLCTIQKFPLQLLEDKSLLCHIATDHLPLHCTLCGDLFKTLNDLQSFGTCRWWKSRHGNSRISDQQLVLGRSPSLDANENVYNHNFVSLTSPPELQRNTSTPMVVSQKSNLDLKTPTVPNFSLKTPKTNSPSLPSEIHSDFRDSGSISHYVSFPSSVSQKETPFRSACSNRGNADSLPRSNSRQLGIMKEQEEQDTSVNNEMDNMELTCVEDEVLSDSKDICVQNFRRRSDSLKRVRFSDQHDSAAESDAPKNYNATENEEFFEACDTMPNAKESLENSRIQIYENAENIEKDKCSPNKSSVEVNQSSSLTRFVMMMVMESGSNLSTGDLISSSLKKFDSITSSTNNMLKSSHSCSSCSCLSKAVDRRCSVSSHECYSSSTQMINAVRRDSSSSNSSGGSSSSGGLFSTVANAVKSVVKSISGMTMSGSIEREEVSQREDIVARPSTSTTFIPLSQYASSLMQRPGKRSRDTLDNSPSSQRQLSLEMPQFESMSPLRKRHRGWTRIKGREPIARMRNNQLTSPRGVSSETQVFHQGALSVGDTILPLPNRAHQSTQTD
ncbi:uncharacterized protein LOC143209565 [Lasioglossum baleicum]|uniref:uncharacterized protein LOC143209565 n=1 Tax=Lasioglossum baleicum TaxID=434251 RepID=UPI003FCC2AE1